jgi:hypothetical protein
MKPVLNGCPNCVVCNRLWIELEEDTSEMVIVCSGCGYHIKMATQLMPGFSKDKWLKHETKDSMYRYLNPIFSAWNGKSTSNVLDS